MSNLAGPPPNSTTAAPLSVGAPTEAATPLPPPPAFPMAPPPFDGGLMPAPTAYPYSGQAYLTPTQDALVAQTSGLAIASLVCSLAALSAVILTFTIILCIPGVVLGHIALWRIGHSQGQLKGKGLAIAGLVVGYCIFALLLLGIVAIVLLVTPVGVHSGF